MKSYIDLFETLKGEFIASLKYKNRFKKYWGTEFIDGIEVLKKQFTVYPNTGSDRVQKLLKLLGSRSSINSANFEGIESYYFFLNPSKSDTMDDENIDQALAAKINNYVGVDGKVESYLVFTIEKDPNYFKGFTNQQIINYITNDYDTNYNLLSGLASGKKISDETIGGYLLFDNGQHFNTTITNATVSAYKTFTRVESESGSVKYISKFITQIAIEIKAIQTSYVTSTSNIVIQMKNEQKELNRTGLQMFLESTENEIIQDGEQYSFRKVRAEKTDYIWYKGQFRVSFLEDKLFKNRDKLKILLSSVDTGYVKKKVKWYKKALGFILIVIAVVIAVFSVGTSAPLSTMLAAIGTAVGVSTMVMVGIQSYLAKHGDPNAAGYMGRWIKIGGIISIVAGISAVITNISRQAAIEAAKETIIKTGVSEATASSSVALMDIAGIESFNLATGTTVGLSNYASATMNMLSSSFSTGWKSITSTALKVTNYTLKTISSMRLESAQNEVNSLRDEYNKSQEEITSLTDKELHIGIENIKWYTNPLTIDNMRFDTNHLYEGTKFNIGRPSFRTALGHNFISNDIYDVNKI